MRELIPADIARRLREALDEVRRREDIYDEFLRSSEADFSEATNARLELLHLDINIERAGLQGVLMSILQADDEERRRHA